MSAGRLSTVLIKPPTLVSIDCQSGILRRYHRVFDVSGASLGWQLKCTHKAKAGPEILPVIGGFDGKILLDGFRMTGATTVKAADPYALP